MESTELKKGNLLIGIVKNYSLPEPYLEEKILEVKNFDDIGVNFQLESDPYSNSSAWLDYECQLKDVKPIPLTEEWLVKFGFQKDLRGFYTKENSQLIEVYFHDRGVQCLNDSVCLNHIQHVHQLQNLYHALTGEELKLNA